MFSSIIIILTFRQLIQCFKLTLSIIYTVMFVGSESLTGRFNKVLFYLLLLDVNGILLQHL